MRQVAEGADYEYMDMLYGKRCATEWILETEGDGELALGASAEFSNLSANICSRNMLIVNTNIWKAHNDRLDAHQWTDGDGRRQT